jgi:hypothetical protein
MQLVETHADLFAPSTWRPFIKTSRVEYCLILFVCVSKKDERLSFETDVCARDKFQGGIWRVCLKSNARVRYFFALSRR